MIAIEIATSRRWARLHPRPGIGRTGGGDGRQLPDRRKPDVLPPAFCVVDPLLQVGPAVSQVVRVPRLVASIIACFFLVLAVVGVMLPGLPTVPFLLLAAWFSARGSERLHRWLYAHPQLGKLLIDWETQRAISRRSKVIALLMLLVSWVVMYRHITSAWILAGVTLLFISVAVYLASRREPG